METTLIKERFNTMREIAVQEKDLTFQWRGGKGKLLNVKMKKAKTLEMWANKLITKTNITEISTIRIMKNGRSVNLVVDPKRNTYKESFSGKYDAPVFYITSEITKSEYEKIFK